ncbi:MAG: arsenate reductase (glutaredoxin) [Nannocystaceae bacterium]
MSSSVVIYHNPRCSKSRQTLALLREHGIEPTVIRYLDTPPDITTLEDLVAKLGIEAHGLVRRKEARYRELQLSPDLPAAKVIAAMAENPQLIERPIVVAGNRAAIGRPPENVLGILPNTPNN